MRRESLEPMAWEGDNAGVWEGAKWRFYRKIKKDCIWSYRNKEAGQGKHEVKWGVGGRFILTSPTHLDYCAA